MLTWAVESQTKSEGENSLCCLCLFACFMFYYYIACIFFDATFHKFLISIRKELASESVYGEKAMEVKVCGEKP